MKMLLTTLSAVVLTVFFSSCSWLKEKYGKNEAASVAYLSQKKAAPARMNIEGLWYSPQWGIVVLNQEPDGKLSGIFRDHYVVNGVVSDKKAFITLIDDDWVDTRWSWRAGTGRNSRASTRPAYLFPKRMRLRLCSLAWKTRRVERRPARRSGSRGVVDRVSDTSEPLRGKILA